MNSRERAELDRYITGNYGEDQFKRPSRQRVAYHCHLCDCGKFRREQSYLFCKACGARKLTKKERDAFYASQLREQA